MNTIEQLRLRAVEWIVLALVTIGAITWGLVGLAGFIGGNLNVVNLVFGAFPTIESLVYLLVGIAGVYMLYFGVKLYGARTREPMETVEPEPTPK